MLRIKICKCTAGEILLNKKCLTQEIAIHFFNKANSLRKHDTRDEAHFRCLKKELMDLYDVTEIEAINILNGYHISDYVRKYEIIYGKVELHIDENKRKANRELLLKIAELEDELKKLAMENENI